MKNERRKNENCETVRERNSNIIYCHKHRQKGVTNMEIEGSVAKKRDRERQRERKRERERERELNIE